MTDHLLLMPLKFITKLVELPFSKHYSHTPQKSDNSPSVESVTTELTNPSTCEAILKTFDQETKTKIDFEKQ